MAGGLFELRKDSVTGWWVAVVVDREFRTERFHRPATHRGQSTDDCPNCDVAADERSGSGCSSRDAFILAGTEREKEAARRPGRQRRRSSACSATRVVADDRGAPRPPRVARRDDTADRVRDARARARALDVRARAGQDRVPARSSRTSGRQAGALTDHLCLDFYDMPQIPHRIGEELGGAARYRHPRGRLPVLPARPRRGRQSRATGLRGRASVCFAPYAVALAVRAVGRAAPPRGRLRRAPRTPSSPARRRRLQGPALLLDALDGPAYNLILHTAPLHERVDETYHWHWEIHPRLREIAGLELGTGLPVNPVGPKRRRRELLADRQGGGDRRPAWPSR